MGGLCPRTRDPTWKITEVKRARSMAQEVEHFPSKFKALSSKPLLTRHWWLKPIILDTWEAEDRRIMVPG
jgi:hypothetical protein